MASSSRTRAQNRLRRRRWRRSTLHARTRDRPPTPGGSNPFMIQTQNMLIFARSAAPPPSPCPPPGEHGEAFPSEHNARPPPSGASHPLRAKVPGPMAESAGRQAGPPGRGAHAKMARPELRRAGPLVIPNSYGSSVTGGTSSSLPLSGVQLGAGRVRREGGVCARGGVDDLSSTLCCPRQISRAPTINSRGHVDEN
jgi:hypothetical protein